MINYEFNEFEVLPASPEEGGGDPGYIPSGYTLTISYY